MFTNHEANLMLKTIKDLAQFAKDCENCEQLIDRLIEQRQIVAPELANLIIAKARQADSVSVLKPN